jgi:hypothetical protein
VTAPEPLPLDVDLTPPSEDEIRFAAERSVMPATSEWGTAAEAAHAAGFCLPTRCRWCVQADAARGES